MNYSIAINDTRFLIRRAVPTDAATLASIGRKISFDTFAQHNSEENMRLFLDQTFNPKIQLNEIIDPKRRIFILWDNQHAAQGYFHLLADSKESCVSGPKPIELLRFYVDHSLHGQGIAHELMRICLEECRSSGFETLWLGVWEKNFKAQAFYKKWNFQEVGSHVFKVGNDPQCDLIYQRSIN